ncbi:hypothetical protein RUM44_009918 [Polyplax serrata]|uniref:C2H2-type domain-containing protein n=1 Tax=Polyplax serrata TaxID=468196 RepID=A0ABR1AUN3_POLSC
MIKLSYYAAAVAPRLVPPLKRPRLMVAQTRSTKNATTATATPTPNANCNNQIKTFTSQPVNGISTAVVPVTTSSDQIKIYNNPDILICGNCREMFTELQDLLDHKKAYCKLRFTCKCNTINGIKSRDIPPDSTLEKFPLVFFSEVFPMISLQAGGTGDLLFASNRTDAAALLCVQCKDAFISAWDLMVHVQAAHMVNIYELGVPKCSNGTQHSSPSMSPVRKKVFLRDYSCETLTKHRLASGSDYQP